MWYIYTMECYSAMKKNETMPFAATWIDLEIITLSEVSQGKTNMIWYYFYVESKIWYKWTYLENRNRLTGTSLVAQWLRICLPMQWTRVRALVQEDSTCHRATKPMRHNCWACALEPASHNYWGHMPQLLKPEHLEPILRNKRSHHNEKSTHRKEE